MSTDPKLATGLFQNRTELMVFIFVGAVVIAIGVVTAMLGPKTHGVKRRTAEASVASAHLSATWPQNALVSEAEALRARLSRMEKQVSSVLAIAATGSVTPELAAVLRSVEDIRSRLKNLEDMVAQDPRKAIELSLLRSQIENMNSGRHADLVAIRREIDQIDSLAKLLATLVFSMILGVASVPITRLVKRRTSGSPT